MNDMLKTCTVTLDYFVKANIYMKEFINMAQIPYSSLAGGYRSCGHSCVFVLAAYMCVTAMRCSYVSE